MATSRSITVSAQGVIDKNLVTLRDRVGYLAESLGNSIQGIEIGLFIDHLDAKAEMLEDPGLQNILAGYTDNTLHTAARDPDHVDVAALDRFIDIANDWWSKGLITAASTHLDILPYFDHIAERSNPGLKWRYEVLGSSSTRGNTIAEVATARERFPTWGFILDVAHTTEMAMLGQEGPKAYIAEFADVLEQVHFSWPEDLYDKAIMGENFRTAHSLAALAPERARPVLDCLNNIPCQTITLEGVIPAGNYGIELLAKERDLAMASF